MTTKRTPAGSKPDAPVTGVAAGSLGTAANLDDTQVMRTADLAEAAPGWLDDDAPEAADARDAQVPEPVAAEPMHAPRPRPRPLRALPQRTPPCAVATISAFWRNRGGPQIAGVAALVVLLLVAGSGFLSQLDLGVGAGVAPAGTDPALLEAGPTPTAAPQVPKHEKCHGRGHDCPGTGG